MTSTEMDPWLREAFAAKTMEFCNKDGMARYHRQRQTAIGGLDGYNNRTVE